jgi:hypothetical protein
MTWQEGDLSLARVYQPYDDTVYWLAQRDHTRCKLVVESSETGRRERGGGETRNRDRM